MKPFSSSFFSWIVGLCIACALPIPLFAQFDYVFRNPVLVSGTDKQINAVYRYTNVRTGVDALLTVQLLGNSATIDSIDRVSTGYAQGFQPMLRIPARRYGYGQFKIDFVVTGTSIPAPQTRVHVTPLDVDGYRAADSMIEYQTIDLGGGYVNFNTSAGGLILSQSITSFTGRNINGIEYPGIDTGIAARAVMFTVSHYNVTSVTIRMGCENRTNAMVQRNLSVVFADFLYSSEGVLKSHAIVQLSAANKTKSAIVEWKITGDEPIIEMFLERSTDQRIFNVVHKSQENVHSGSSYSYSDNSLIPGKYYYRVKIVNKSGAVQYSKIAAIIIAQPIFSDLHLFPFIVNNDLQASYHSSKNQQAIVRIFDMNGKEVHHHRVNLFIGSNSIAVPALNRLRSGIYIFQIDGKSQRFVK